MSVAETKDAIRKLSALADRHASGFPKVAVALRATCDHLERRLEVDVVRVLLAGSEDARRAVLAALAGDELFGGGVRLAAGATLTVARGASDRYVARMGDGTSEDFARGHPDKRRWYDGVVAEARAEHDGATATLANVQARIDVVRRERAASTVDRAEALSIWARFVLWLFALFGRPAPALAPPPSRRGSEEVEAMIVRRDLSRARDDARVAVAKTRAKLDRIVDEAARHRDERRRAFAAGVRALLSAGDRVVDVTIELASGRLPEGIVLVDAPAERWRVLRETIAACIVAAAPGTFAVADLEAAIAPLVPRALDAGRIGEDLASLLGVIREEAPLAVTALATADVPARIGSLAKAALDAEAEHRARVEALERERLPAPEAFRTEQMAKTAGAIDEGARRVAERAREELRRRVAELEKTWTTAIEACPDRGALARRIATIDAAAPASARALLDGLGDVIGAEMQAISENLQVWILEEVRQQYRTRYLHVDPTSVVVAELPSDELATTSSPLGAALVRSGRRRIAFGLGGAIVVALVGTAIQPGIGTVIGAIAGVLLLFVERTRTLRAACVDRVRAWLGDVESAIGARIDAAVPSFARDIRISVEETIEQALRRRDQSIMRLIDDEARSIAEEQEKLRELAELRTALEAHEATFVALAEASAAALRPSRT